MAVPSVPEAAGVRVWRLCHADGSHEWGARRRRALMLPISCPQSFPFGHRFLSAVRTCRDGHL